MAGDRFDLFGAQHARLGAERRLGLLVVEAGVALGHQQYHRLAQTQTQGLGDLARLAAMRQRRVHHGRGAQLMVDDGDIRSDFGQMVANRLQAQDSVSSSSIMLDTTSRPLVQKAGSEASRPNGASSSLCRSVPPALSMSRYFCSKPGIPD